MKFHFCFKYEFFIKKINKNGIKILNALKKYLSSFKPNTHHPFFLGEFQREIYVLNYWVQLLS